MKLKFVAQYIPDSEKWLHTQENWGKLDRALEFAETHTAQDNFDVIAKKIEK